MKQIIILLFITTLLSSCSNDNVNYYCTKSTIRILNKDKHPCVKSGGYCWYGFYLYDSNKAYWCNTNKETFEFYNIGDTLSTLVISKTMYQNIGDTIK